MDDDFKNAIVYNVSQENLVHYLSFLSIDAFVSPTVNNCVAFYPKLWVEEGPSSAPDLLRNVSRRFGANALRLEIFNEVVFEYELYYHGSEVDTYTSFPGYADTGEQNENIKTQANRLCSAFGVQTSLDLVIAILSLSNPFHNASQRCKTLAVSLNIPVEFVGLNYFLLGDNFFYVKGSHLDNFVVTTV